MNLIKIIVLGEKKKFSLGKVETLMSKLCLEQKTQILKDFLLNCHPSVVLGSITERVATSSLIKS